MKSYVTSINILSNTSTELFLVWLLWLVQRFFIIYATAYWRCDYLGYRATINTLAEAQFKKAIGLKILLILGAASATGFFTFWCDNPVNVLRFIEYDLKNEIYAHYQRLCLPFYKQNRTGDL